ncbi:MAG: hypothetical protein ACE5OY_00385 [Candidatus Bathyarchaeia archaeon]
MPSLSWGIIPPHTLIVDLLSKKGSMTAETLYKSVRKTIEDLSRREFDATLMRLEVQGLIRVYVTSRERRVVELVEKGA